MQLPSKYAGKWLVVLMCETLVLERSSGDFQREKKCSLWVQRPLLTIVTSPGFTSMYLLVPSEFAGSFPSQGRMT